MSAKPYEKHLFERLRTLEDMIGYLNACHAEGPDVFALAVKDAADAAFTAGQIAERGRILNEIQETRRATVWAYKSHEAIGMVLDDVVHNITKGLAAREGKPMEPRTPD